LIRAFFALEPDATTRRLLAGHADGMRDQPWAGEVRWVPPENIHLTLRFLGDIPEDATDELVEVVASATRCRRAFEIELRDTLLLPSRRRPRVIAVGVAPSEPLDALAVEIETAVVAQGLAPEQRSFRAHVTLGRLRRSPRAPLGTLAPPPLAAFDVEHFVLLRSRLRERGAEYSVLHHFALADGSAQG
jgi:2'-5' RNA ligase